VLDSIDPRYAQRATAARGERKHVPTLTTLPDPKTGPTTYDVGGVTRILDEWAEVSGISKTTLHHRVVKKRMPMADALSLGKGTKGKRLPGSSDCRTGAATEAEKVDVVDAQAVQPKARPRRKRARKPVPRDGIEPPTRGFSMGAEGRGLRRFREILGGLPRNCREMGGRGSPSSCLGRS
jgi:hypothetical protein